MSLYNKYLELLKDESPDGKFLSSKITSERENRIAIDSSGVLSILIPTGKFDTIDFSPVKLSNIRIQPSVNCKIIDGSDVFNDVFTIVSFYNDSEQLKEYFLKVIEIVFNDLPLNPTVNEIINTVFYLVEIFRYVNDSGRKTILGLWGELFFIENSTNTEELLSIWHTDVYEYLDFSSSRKSFEIKCSTNENRIHEISNQQLLINDNTIIVSILTKQIIGGVSINDLVQRISEKINSTRLINKLNLVVSQALGKDVLYSHEKSYDYNLAKESIKYYSVMNLPRIKPNHIPKEISNLRYRMNFSEFNEDSLDN